MSKFFLGGGARGVRRFCIFSHFQTFPEEAKANCLRSAKGFRHLFLALFQTEKKWVLVSIQISFQLSVRGTVKENGRECKGNVVFVLLILKGDRFTWNRYVKLWVAQSKRNPLSET